MYVTSRVAAVQQYLPPTGGKRGTVGTLATGAPRPAAADGEADPADRATFPRSPDLTELASRLEPPERARQLALALEGPGVPVPLKLATLRMMLEGSGLPQPEPPPPAVESKSHDRSLEATSGTAGDVAEHQSEGEPPAGTLNASRTADLPTSLGREVLGAGVPGSPTVPGRAKAPAKSGSVTPPALAAHVYRSGPGTPAQAQPKSHVELKG